jgi:NAD(P)-dependent dehydrogenase (short-subunit alcohol dehydrogenase family)
MSNQTQSVLITGGARGIGAATAKAFKAAGFLVAICDVDADALAATQSTLGLDVALQVDLSRREDLLPLMDAVDTSFGRLSVLINNAGIMPAGPVLEETDGMTERMLDVNLLAPIILTRRALRSMLAAGGGHIINVASMGADIATPGIASYCGSKAGIVNFTDAARIEYRDSGVHFTTVHPATVATDLASGIGVVRGSKIVSADDVAAGILAAVRHPRDRVYVPPFLGLATRGQRLLPPRVAAAFGRAIGADTVALNYDTEGRQAYNERIGRDGSAPSS